MFYLYGVEKITTQKMKNQVIETSTLENESAVYWKLPFGTKMKVIKEYFRNGEHHLNGVNADTGENMDYPSTFFTFNRFLKNQS